MGIVKGLEDICPREQVFDALSTLDQRGHLHQKPDPRGYRMVLAELGFLTESCIVVDNSRKNARAAKRKVGCAGSIYIGTHLKTKDRGVIDYRAASFDSLMASIADALAPSKQAAPNPEPTGLGPDGRAAGMAGLRRLGS